MVPLLRLWVKKTNKKAVEYFLILAAIFCSTLPLVFDVLKLFKVDLFNIDKFINNAYIFYVTGFIPFLIMGWYLHNFSIKKEIVIHVLSLVSFAFTIFGSWGFSTILDRRVLLYNGLYLTIALNSASVFLLIKRLFINRSPKTKFVSWNIEFIAKYSLGFYVSHVGFCYMLSRIIDRNWTYNALIAIPICFAGGFILSYLFTFLVSRIPFIRKIV